MCKVPGDEGQQQSGLRWPYDMGQWGEVMNLELGPQKVPVGGKKWAVKASNGDAATVTP